MPAVPSPSADDGAAAQAFAAIVARLDEVVPQLVPVDGPDMAGCSARLLDAVEVAVRSR